MTASQAIQSSVQTVLTYQPSAADSLLKAILLHTNALTKEYEAMFKSMSATREAREAFLPMELEPRQQVKGQYIDSDTHRGFDSNAVRQVGMKLAASATNASSLASALLLIHVGTSVSHAR